MRKGQAAVKQAHFTDADLSRKILVDGELRTVGEVTAEEFDEYIYQILGRMYEKQKSMLNKYEESFDYDWAYPYYRVIALNELYALNLKHVSDMGKTAVPLFVEEEQVL